MRPIESGFGILLSDGVARWLTRTKGVVEFVGALCRSRASHLRRPLRTTRREERDSLEGGTAVARSVAFENSFDARGAVRTR